MRNFDKVAKDWDQDPIKKDRALVLAKEILKMVPISKKTKALEYGAGTGLVSFNLSKYLKEIILMDSSPKMVQESKKKISSLKILNMDSILYDLLKNNKYNKKFDLIYTLLTLHHIVNTEKILKKFFELLENNGYLCIADIISEDGSFHHKFSDFSGHNGFKMNELIKILSKIGFKNFEHKIFYTLEKVINSKTKKFPLFILIAQKINN